MTQQQIMDSDRVFSHDTTLTLGAWNRQETSSGKKAAPQAMGEDQEREDATRNNEKTRGSAAPRMHFQMWILAQPLNVDVPATTADLFKLLSFFRPAIFAGFPDGLNDGQDVFS